MKLTENAVMQIKKILSENNNLDSYLRVGITGSRCSGPVYSFHLDNEYNSELDVLVNQDELKIITEKTFEEVLTPVIIDYAEIDGKRGFTFSNPLSVLTGGCGSGCSSGCSSK